MSTVSRSSRVIDSSIRATGSSRNDSSHGWRIRDSAVEPPLLEIGEVRRQREPILVGLALDPPFCGRGEAIEGFFLSPVDVEIDETLRAGPGAVERDDGDARSIASVLGSGRYVGECVSLIDVSRVQWRDPCKPAFLPMTSMRASPLGTGEASSLPFHAEVDVAPRRHWRDGRTGHSGTKPSLLGIRTAGKVASIQVASGLPIEMRQSKMLIAGIETTHVIRKGQLGPSESETRHLPINSTHWPSDRLRPDSFNRPHRLTATEPPRALLRA